MFQKQKMRQKKQKTPKDKNGYVLIDALVTVFIATTVFSAIIGGISTAAHAIIQSRERILTAIEARNAFEIQPRIKTKNDPSKP